MASGPGESFDAAMSGATPGDTPLVDERVGVRGPGSLRTLAARGIVINTVFLIGLNALGFLKGFAVAAFLEPAEYGVWGLLAVAFATLFQLVQVGVTDKYIQQDQADQELAFQQAFTMQVLLCSVFVVVIAVAMPLYALAYDDWDILLPGYTLALVIPAMALQTPLWAFYRNMDFLTQRKLQAFDPIIGFVVTIGLAAAGFGYWSLVIGVVVGGWAAAIVAVRASPYRIRLNYERGTLREYWGFSGPLFYAAMIVIVIGQVPVLVGKHAVGLLGVGVMAIANNISQYASRVDDIVTNTLYPAVCAVKDRSDLLLESFLKSNRLAMLWAGPVGAGIALFAPDLVRYLLGAKWEVAVFAIQAFGVSAAINQIGFNWSAFYRALGDTKPIPIAAGWMCVGVLGFAVPLLIVEGVDGYAVGMGLAIVLSIVVRIYYLARLFPVGAVLGNCARGVLPTVPGIAAVVGLRLALWGGDRPAWQFLAEIAAFGLAAGATTVYAERRLLREFRAYLTKS